MFRRFSTDFAVFSILLDAVLVSSSLALADLIRPALNNLGIIKDIGGQANVPLELYPIFAFIWIMVFLGMSVYDGRKNYRVLEELSSLTWAVLLTSIASAGVLYLSYREISRALFLLFILFAGLSMVAWRMFYRWWLRKGANGSSQRRVAIVGNGEAGNSIKAQIEGNPMFGLNFCGFFGNNVGENSLGGYDQIHELVTKKSIDDLVITLPGDKNDLIKKIVSDLNDVPVNLWVVPDYYSLALHKACIEEYAGITMLDLRAPALNEYQRMMKRVLDLTGAVLLLPIAIPIMLLLGTLIYIFDPGPIVFNQVRAGENGKPFTMHKFRTMVVGAEKISRGNDTNHKTKNDPRVTTIGRILRKTSLDELPQLFNVIKGEMSFVGPRPELLDLVENYEPWQRARFAVPPGITGWWQVNGRSDKPMHLNTEDDIYYLNNYSLWLDIQIIVRTIWVTIIGRGAY
jgi:exopolysaccharide biosynthesis polyprenyl glycosylphosphotransferase